MKKYVFLIIATDNNEVIAVYDDESVANKLTKPIEDATERKVTVKKCQVNKELSRILNG